MEKPQKIETGALANQETLDNASAVTIKFFIGLLYAFGAILTVVVTVGFVFGVWDSMDQILAARLPSLK